LIIRFGWKIQALAEFRFMMTGKEIRQSFLDFFKSKEHTIVPSSSLLPDAPNLLFTNAGMNQFVPVFLGQRAPDVNKWPGAIPGRPTRAADTQKCIRAGGKHNDLEDVGLDTYHHTFFEMLGNWSFGDYFKKEAIRWAWELVVNTWRFPANRLYATVYKPDKSAGDPAEFDQEAHDHWRELFQAAGLDAKVHIQYSGKKDNFWMMGETGPCGPCSELHVDLTPAGDTRGTLVNAGSAQCIEIWNLVFIQFNANLDKTYSPLPANHVDTGMGFERVCGIIQNTRKFTDFSRVVSNYETDVFRPIFDKIEELSGKKYASTLPKPGSTGETEQEKVDVAFRVIADHIRTLTFGIADGIEPGNKERNSVLRRILRRAVRYGRTLGFHEPFFSKLVGVVADTMGDVFPEVRAKRARIEEVIRREEEAFNRTLDEGIKLFEEEIAFALAPAKGSGTERRVLDAATIVLPEERSLSPEERTKRRRERRSENAAKHCVSGEAAFVLSDTYGFPLDLTKLMARERGFAVDEEEFDQFLAEAKRIAREARVSEVVQVSDIESKASTRFVGYDTLSAKAGVIEVFRVKDRTAVVLDTSPAYAEMGGQVGDTGQLSHGGQLWRIVNTQKAANTWLHLLAEQDAPVIGIEVEISVDRDRRSAIQRHHTVTHLLHWALHEVVSKDATQKGSFVGPEKLTFDFSSAALTPQQLQDVEKLVNERIVENAAVSWTEVPYAEVKPRSDILQFFGDKYGDVVRVVQIGGKPGELNGYSMELCGGTHTRATGEVGLFRIVGESAIAAGIRRIEAVSGLEAYEKVFADASLISGLAARLNAPIGELGKKLDALLAQQKELERQLKSVQQKQAAETARSLVPKAKEFNGTRAIIENLGVGDGDLLQGVADALKGQFKGVVVLGATANEAVSLVATVSSELTAKIQAGKIIQAIAPVVGGKGGGRPDNARGGGRDAAKLDEALAKAASLV
jgi:alanyl-tRNA synthetase